MNKRSYSPRARWLTAVLGFLLVLLCLLAPGHLTQAVHSEDLQALESAANPTALEQTPCTNPVPPGDKVRIVGDDEILLSFRQANESKYLANQIINNPVGSTLMTASSVQFLDNKTLDPYATNWVVNTSGDLDGNGYAEILTAGRNYYSELTVLDNIYNWSIVSEWLNSASPFAGSTVSWIDVAAGNLDRVSNPSTGLDEDEIVVAFKDNNSDIHVVLLDGDEYPLAAWIGNVDNSLMSQWTKSDLERGTVNHVTVTTADLDGDGFDDEIVVAYKDSGSDLQVEILEYNGTTTLQELWRIDSQDNGRGDVAADGSGDYANKWPIDITTGDLDGDMMDEVVLAFRIGSATNGDVQLWALDVTNPADWTIDSSVSRNHPVPSATRSKAATAVSVSAADLDSDGYDEIALAYNIAQTDTCNDSGYSYACNSRWRQQLVTYEYTPFFSPEYIFCPAGSPPYGCFRQRPGTWTSTINYGRDESAEGQVVIATGDLDQDTQHEIALAHYKWENDNIEVISFDAEDSLTLRSALETELGSNRPTGFWIAMGDRDNDSRYVLYDGSCYVKTEAQVASVIYAPPHWPEEHIAANDYNTFASFESRVEQATGTSTEVSTSFGGSVTVGPSFHEIGASFTYGWEKEAFAEQSETTFSDYGLKYSTCPPHSCPEESDYNAVQFVETTFHCFGYVTVVGAEKMEVCLPVYYAKLPRPQKWWYTTGYETYPESWIPLGHNLAQGRSATQSSEDPSWPGPAGRAVDGDANGEFASGHVSHTGYENSPWWQVDLGGTQWLGAIQAWNRTELGYTGRLKDFYVLVSEKPFPAGASLETLLADPEIWRTFIAGEAGRPTVIPVDHHGRYVRVQRPVAKGLYLDIAELEVFGMPGAVDQWPKAKPTTPNSDTISLTWPDPNLPNDQLVQTVPGQLLAVDFDKTSIRDSTSPQDTDVGFGREYETITGGKTAEETSVGMEIRWIEGEVSTTTSKKTSYALSWSNKVGFFGSVDGLPSKDKVPTIEDYWYDFSQYAWLQRARSAGGVEHAYLVNGYWVPLIGPFAGAGAPPPPVTGGPAATPATPLINSASHPNPDKWVDSDSASFNWKQPASDSTVISGYTWLLDQTADTIPNEVNKGLVTTKSFDALADGVWYLHVRAVSTGGQWSETAHRAVRVDVTPPEVAFNLDPEQPSGDNGWYITPVTIAVDAADGDGSGVAKVEVSSDGVAWQPYAAPLEFTEDTAGTSVYARATDAAGHAAEPVTTTFRIDQTAPDSHIDGGAGPGTWIAEIMADEHGNEELVLAGSFADDLSGRSGFSLAYDGLDWIGASKTGSWYPIPDQPQIEVNWVFTATHEIGAGYHIFMGQAQDVAGNQEEAYEIARVLWLPQASPDFGGSSVATSAAAIRPGERVALALVARNDGVQEAYVTITDRLPEGLSPVLDVLPADVEYDPDMHTLTWPDQLLWPGEHRQHIFLAEADAALPAVTLENEASFHAFWPNTDLLPPAERQPFLDREQTVTKTTVITVDPALPVDSDRTRSWAILTLGTNVTTTGPQVDLTVVAPDDARWMYLREWAPDPDTGAWIVMQDSGWLPFKSTTSWTLSEGQGVKYLGVWVADRSGNVSNLSEYGLAFVNRLDSSQALADGQRVQYRAFLEEGMELMAALKTVSGDPDVYAWRPRSAFWPDRYSNDTVEPGDMEDLGYGIIQRSGRYLLEVHAVGASEYELALSDSDSPPSMARQALTDKGHPARPLVVGDPLTANQIGPLVSLEHRTYLPLVARN